MKQFLAVVMIIVVLTLTGVAAVMGGYIVSDLSLWQALFTDIARKLFIKPVLLLQSHTPNLLPLERALDRIVFLQVNDPLLI